MINNIYYFVRAHTAKGHINKLQDNLDGLDKVYVIQGGLEEKAYFFTLLKSKIKTHKQLEWLISANIPTIYEGVIWREEKIALLDETIITSWEVDYELIELSNQKSSPSNFDQVYEHLSRALESHLQLEKIYISYMDFSKADKIIEELKQDLEGLGMHREGKPFVYERFFGSFSLNGSINKIPSLLTDMKKVYHIKGKAGTGKSHLLKSIIQFCQKQEISHEIYYCSFDPSSVDMVIIRDYGICLFDSTAPHAYTPKSQKESIIDMYERTVDPQVETVCKEEIAWYLNKYQKEIQKAKEQLSKIRDTIQLEQIKPEKKQHIGNQVKQVIKWLGN